MIVRRNTEIKGDILGAVCEAERAALREEVEAAVSAAKGEEG